MLTLDDVFNAPLPRFEPLDVANEVALVRLAQSGSQRAMTELLSQYRLALRAEFARVRRVVVFDCDTDELRQNVLLGFVEAVHATQPGKRVADRLAQAFKKARDTHGLVGVVSVPPRTRQRYFQAVREAGEGGDAEAKAVELGMSREVFRAVREAFSGTSLDEAVEQHDTLSTVEARVLVDTAISAVDGDTAGMVEDAYGFALYDGPGMQAVRHRCATGESFDPLPDAEVAYRRGVARTTVQRRRTEGLVTMRRALGVAPTRTGHDGATPGATTRRP